MVVTFGREVYHSAAILKVVHPLNQARVVIALNCCGKSHFSSHFSGLTRQVDRHILHGFLRVGEIMFSILCTASCYLFDAEVAGLGLVAGQGVGARVLHGPVVQRVVERRQADAPAPCGRPPRLQLQLYGLVRAALLHGPVLLVVVRDQTQRL